jgi:hypothetical protein
MKDFLEHAVFELIQAVVELIASRWDRDEQPQ